MELVIIAVAAILIGMWVVSKFTPPRTPPGYGQ